MLPADETEGNFTMKMWDGRFSKASDKLMEQFHNSLPFDRALIEKT